MSATYEKSTKKIKLQIVGNDGSGNEVKYTIDYINPNATTEQLYKAAEGLNDALTYNYFHRVERIEYAELLEVSD